ncbi:MAG: prepilin peptidase, partial [Pusillimonas sp.]|nr:prepilin peptidase [Pusillimonas sp.]
MQSEVAIFFAVAGAVLLGLCGRLAANGVRNIHVLTAQGARGVGVRWQRGLAGALLLGAFLGAWVGARHGASVYALCLLGALGVLVMLAIIDAFTGLLPDELTLPLLWLGLLLSWLGISPVSLHQSVGGAVVGYGFLWLLALVFFWVRGKEGMGHGDFKLTAAMGAWLGYGILPFVLLLACALGLLVVFFRYFSKRALYADYVGEPGSVWA